MSIASARAAAMQAANEIVAPVAAGVSYASRGVVLVTGKAERVLPALAGLPAPLRVVAFVPDGANSEALSASVRLVAAPIKALTGHLGGFSAHSIPVAGQPVDAGRFSWNEDRKFDLVLDLSDAPLIAREIPPFGYYAPRTVEDVKSALQKIREHAKEWRKPRYVDYRDGLCAHGAAGLTGCTRCIDACPAGAISSAGHKVYFDPFLCHGCGTCTAVCPSGAVRFAVPPAETLLERLCAMLAAWRRAGAPPPRLLIYAGSDLPRAPSAVNEDDNPVLPFRIEALAAAGIEFWFAALAWGANQVALAPAATTTRASLTALAEEVSVAKSILAAIGDAPARIVVGDAGDAEAAPPSREWRAVAALLPKGDKRATFYAALDHLTGTLACPMEDVPLPHGAEFGAVAVDQASCTLCFACVNLCPAQALSRTDGAAPELLLAESRCVQCGLCVNGCPERAITLIPRVQLKAASRNVSTTLCADEPFRCIRCGSPFMSKRMLAKSIEVMKGHPLIEKEGIDRLRMCMPCRAAATMTDTVPPVT